MVNATDADRWIRAGTAAAVLFVAAIAAIVSFVHIQDLAVTHGQTWLASVLLPLSIDGTVAAASLVMLRAARNRIGTPWLARTMLSLAVLATLAANVGYGLPYGIPGALLSGWPAVAFVGCAEMAIGMVRRITRQDAGKGRRGVPASVPVPVKEGVREIRARHRVSQATAVKMRNYAAERVRATQNGGHSEP